MGLLCSLYALEPISYSNLILGKRLTFLKVQNRQLGTRLVSGYIFEYGNSFTSLKTYVELPPNLQLYPRLTLGIFIADLFHTIAKASSIIISLHGQFFANTKSFELGRLSYHIYKFSF